MSHVAFKYDIAVAYRVYPGISKTPAIYSDDKFKLVEIGLRSFKASLGTLKAKLWVILDGCPPAYETLFTRYFDRHDLEFVILPGVGNAATFKTQIECLLTQEASSLVYLAEDDYFYLPQQFEHMVHFLTSEQDVHFLTPYDHPDYYSLGLHDQNTDFVTCGQKRWRRVSTTCLTFLTTRDILHKTAPVFYTYTQNNYDNSIWLSLTKYPLLHPIYLFRTMAGPGGLWKSVIKAWLFGWRQICFGKRWQLWSPVPTVGTHLEQTDLAPGIDWSIILKEAVDQLQDDR